MRWTGRAAVVVLAVIAPLVAVSCSSSSPPGASATSGPVTSESALPSPTAVPSPALAGTAPTGDLAFLGPVHQVPVNGITMGYRQFGAGPPLVLIVGQDSAMSYWGPDLLRQLADHYQVTMFDNRGVGYSSDQPDQPLTIQMMSDDTAGLIQALALDKPAVFGWSTGGEIGLALAVRHPDQVGSLAVSGATAGSPASVPSPPTDPADVGALLNTLFTPSGAAARQRYIDGIVNMPAETVSPEISQRQADSETRFAAATDVYDALPSVQAPVLVTDGAEDQLVPVANAQLIAGRIRGAKLVLVPDAAHAWMMQYLDRFVATLTAFTSGQPLP